MGGVTVNRENSTKMAAFSEINLQVGAKLQMTLKSGPKQGVFYTELIGYAEGEYLIIKTPFEHGLSVQLWEGQQLNFRIFSGVNIFTFNCVVKHVFTAPYHYLHISFPADVQATALRNAIRAKVDRPVQINGSIRPATITNLSVSGAGIISDDRLGKQGDELLISFSCPISLINQQVTIKTTVRICSVQQLPDKQEEITTKWLYGVMFHDLSPTHKVMLQNFIYESLNRKSLSLET